MIILSGRYCLSVNIIGFAYSALQACDLTCQLATGKHFISHHLRNHFDFFMDQACPTTLFLFLSFTFLLFCQRSSEHIQSSQYCQISILLLESRKVITSNFEFKLEYSVIWSLNLNILLN